MCEYLCAGARSQFGPVQEQVLSTTEPNHLSSPSWQNLCYWLLPSNHSWEPSFICLFLFVRADTHGFTLILTIFTSSNFTTMQDRSWQGCLVGKGMCFWSWQPEFSWNSHSARKELALANCSLTFTYIVRHTHTHMHTHKHTRERDRDRETERQTGWE